jgi:glycosyltransferase involved in cell wall biosynthesis
MYILHIPSWFPELNKPYTGNFIEKHIESIASYIPSITLRIEKTSEKNKTMKDELLSPNNRLITYYIHYKQGFISKYKSKIFTHLDYQKGANYIENKYGIPSLIHLHVALPMGGFACSFKKKWNVPLLLSEHWSVYHPENWNKLSRLLKKKLKHVFDEIDGITTVSNHLMKSIKEIYPVKNEFVISNVCKTDIFVPELHHKSKKHIIHISTLDENAKNFKGILNAIEEIIEMRQDFVLDVISEFVKPEIIEYVHQKKMDEYVHFLGSMPEAKVAHHLKKSDFLVLFSNYENQPCVILEAFACGKPIIATSVGGIPEIVTKERGILVQKQDEKALKIAILEMLDTHNEYSEEDIRAYAVDNFSQEIIGKSFSLIYKMLLAH